MARVRALLIREDWIYVLSLLVPVFVYNVVLKVVRIATQFEVPGPLGFLDQVRSGSASSPWSREGVLA